MAEKGVKIDLHNLVHPKTLAEIIKMNYLAFHDTSKLNVEATKSSIKSMPMMIWGSPGCGKSSIVKQCADELGIDFIDARLPQMEPCDIKGLPVPDKENKVMNWFINGMWPRGEDTKGILFLDELSACDKSIAVAAYELILDRRLGKLYHIPDGWMIVAAGNNVTDKAVANTMSSALANRFLHLELETDVDSFYEYAVGHNFHPSVLGYLKWRPSHLFSMDKQNLSRGWPSPRSWENVSKMCYVCKNEDLLRKTVYGLVGNAVGVEFMEFFKLSENFDDILKYMLNDKMNIESKFGPLAELEMSQKYAITAALVYHVWRGKDEQDCRARLDGFFRILSKLSSEFASMGCLGALSGSDRISKADAAKIIYDNPMFMDFISKHCKNLQKRKNVSIDLDE